MGGPAEVALDQMVTDFNNSQNKYEVVPQYEGSYDEAVQKIIQTHGSKSSPALFQSFDISTAQIMHTQYATPIQKFITKEHYDMSPIAPAAKAFFSNNGKQLSMPFNISQPVMYYNASLLKSTIFQLRQSHQVTVKSLRLLKSCTNVHIIRSRE